MINKNILYLFQDYKYVMTLFLGSLICFYDQRILKYEIYIPILISNILF
jgi:hypothetical protein